MVKISKRGGAETSKIWAHPRFDTTIIYLIRSSVNYIL